MNMQMKTGYPSIDKPWLKYHNPGVFDAPMPEHTICEYLWENNKDHLDEVALIYFGKEITFKELFANIEKVAAAFSAIGVKSGDVVAICSVTTPEVIYCIYALSRVGAVSNMIDPRTNIERMNNYLKTSNTKFIVAIDKCLPKIAKIKAAGFSGKVIAISAKDSLSPVMKIGYSLKNKVEKINVGMKWDRFMKLSARVETASYQKDKIATIVYTGGTTGVPKGAMLSDDTLNAIAFQYILLKAEYHRRQTMLNIMPPFIAYGVVCGIHMPLILGFTVVIIPLFNPDEFDKLMIKYKPAHVFGVPTHYEKLAESPKMINCDLSFLVTPGAGGDALSVKMETKINEFLKSHNSRYGIAKGYGMTEVGSVAISGFEDKNKIGSVGIPHCKTIVSAFQPDTDKELTYNQEGEICLSTPAMMVGYMANDEETKKVIRKHSDGTTWIHTGDIGYVDEDGFTFIKGRIKRMIIRPDGHNVFPTTIENVVLEHAAVEGCAVVGKNDPEYATGNWPVAFIVLKPEFKNSPSVLSEIRRLCDNKLPPRDTAIEFFEIDELPLTNIGKVDYKELEERANQ